MCGIVGYFSRKKEDFSQKQFVQALQISNYRGPDYTGRESFEEGCLHLGHNRLSILDLSPLSHQPMVKQEGRFALVFNGEIYNFQKIRTQLQEQGVQFTTSGDTEVLLQSYMHQGLDFLKGLDGMYAFAIYDFVKRKLLLARDLAGEKPLFYFVDGNRFIFASELKQILSFPVSKDLSMPHVDLYFSQGYLPGPTTLFENIQKLPPAHYLEFDLDTFEIKLQSFWQLPAMQNPHSEEEANNTLHRLLQASVTKRMIADTSLGAFLSGGIDSTLVASAMQEASSKPIKTFCMGFEGSAHNELSHAKKVAKAIGSEHAELMVSPNIGDVLEKIVLTLDEPIFDNSIIPTFLLCKEVKNHVTVALSGDGGDEIFAGYHHHLAAQTVIHWQKKTPVPLHNALHQLGKLMPEGQFGKKSLLSFGQGTYGGFTSARQIFFEHEREKLLCGQTISSMYIQEKNRMMEEYVGDLTNKMCFSDFLNNLPQILIKVDRASMMNSLEVRAPFLSKDIIEYSFKHVPGSLKLNSGIKKSILKNILKKHYPIELDLERKQGFDIPVDLLRQSNFLEKFRDLPLPKILNSKYISYMHQCQLDGKGAYWNKLFSIYMFVRWYHQWVH